MRDDLPKGFSASSAAAGFKAPNRPDLGLLYSEFPCVYAGLFTQNRFCAVPVEICKDILKSGLPVRALVANSGQANACTGDIGKNNALECQRSIASMLDIEPNEVLLLSTGVIGAQIKMDKWRSALPELAKNRGTRDAEGFTRAFMTTDAFPKFATTELNVGAIPVRITVMAKGAGMICPNMATMLCVCLTDASLDKTTWQDIFGRAVEKTFNRVSVDGDTSTNDSIIGLANGASNATPRGTDLILFEERITKLLADVAYLLVKDGEGAKKVLHITVTGAATDRDAELVARSVGASQLVKTAIYGGDANWGRIITAIGYSQADFDPAKVSCSLCGIPRFTAGQPINDDKEAELAELLKASDIAIDISLGSGQGTSHHLASDLGHEYVTLNSDYRS